MEKDEESGLCQTWSGTTSSVRGRIASVKSPCRRYPSIAPTLADAVQLLLSEHNPRAKR